MKSAASDAAKQHKAVELQLQVTANVDSKFISNGKNLSNRFDSKASDESGRKISTVKGCVRSLRHLQLEKEHPRRNLAKH